jgi:hypothetical protein
MNKPLVSSSGIWSWWPSAETRCATKKQVQNRRDRPNRNNRNSGVRNVYRDRDRWRAQITADGVAIHIGTFHCIEDADAAARKARACIAA